MKKLLFSLAFIAAMLTSCVSNNAEIDYDGKNAVDVVIDVKAPELATSRSGETAMNSGLGAIDNFSDDEWGRYDLRYIFEVYDITPGYEDYENPVKERIVQTFDQYEPTRFQLRLIPKRTYKFVVWADFVLQGTENDLNYNTTNLKNITRKGIPTAMDESMDAYFVQEDITLTGALSKDFVLTRPFGKLRVITTDINEVNLGSAPSRVDITFYNHNIFASLNALDGYAASVANNVTYSYNIAKGAPYSEGYDKDANNQTLFADYIFTHPQEFGEQEVNFKMSVYGEDNRLIREHDFNTQIPLKRNSLTTIMGNLLTTASQVTISINDDFDGEYIVNNDAVKLAAPTVNTLIEENRVTLSWNAVENADYYTIYYNGYNGSTVDYTTTTEVTYQLNWGEYAEFGVQAHSYNDWTYSASEVSYAYAQIAGNTSTIYFIAENPDMEQVYIYYWDLNGETTPAPGYLMEFAYTTPEGWKVFAYTFDAYYSGMQLNFLFNNGLWNDGNQTEDLSCILGQDYSFSYYLNANNPVDNDKNGYKIYATSELGWSNMNIWLWDDNFQTLTNNKEWPGDAMEKEVIDGVEYFVYTLSESVNNYNIVFNTDWGYIQTVDCTGFVADRDRYFNILNSTDSVGHYYVEEITPNGDGNEGDDNDDDEGNVIMIDIIKIGVGYDQSGEKEIQFWYSDTNAHIIDFKGFDRCVSGQPLVAGYYSSAEGTIDLTYSTYDYGTTNDRMSFAECTITDNGDGTQTYDAKFTYGGQEYAFVYTGAYPN